MQTDSLSYHLTWRQGDYRADARATYRNATGAPVYFERCGDGLDPMFEIVRDSVDTSHDVSLHNVWACVGGVPNGVVAPGESVTVRVPLLLFHPDEWFPLHSEPLGDVFRVQLLLCARYGPESDDCQRLPAAERRSNAFVVHF